MAVSPEGRAALASSLPAPRSATAAADLEEHQQQEKVKYGRSPAAVSWASDSWQDVGNEQQAYPPVQKLVPARVRLREARRDTTLLCGAADLLTGLLLLSLLGLAICCVAKFLFNSLEDWWYAGALR